MEIERKWLLQGFPDKIGLQVETHYTSQQGYLSVHPEIRIRSKKSSLREHCFLTYKGDGTLSRNEINIDILPSQFNQLQQTIPSLITKTCKNYYLPGGLILECSCVDKGTENEFYYAEVEFSSVLQANHFTLPFVAVEVTQDPYYKMKNYWVRTRLGKEDKQ